jgi:asparagine synthase (glutamine-hydrolysing)
MLGFSPPLGRLGVSSAWIAHIEQELDDLYGDFTKLSFLELAHYAGNKLLPDGDVMSMAHGLELRFPFLDFDLVRNVLSTPDEQKRSRNKFKGKPLLVDSIQDFPLDLVSRKKVGFTLPLNQWLMNNLEKEVGDVIQYASLKLNLNHAAVEALIYSFRGNPNGQEWLRVWKLFALGNWLKLNT